jgi:hypothetical protein
VVARGQPRGGNGAGRPQRLLTRYAGQPKAASATCVLADTHLLADTQEIDALGGATSAPHADATIQADDLVEIVPLKAAVQIHPASTVMVETLVVATSQG